jgi:hypothetical protein
MKKQHRTPGDTDCRRFFNVVMVSPPSYLFDQLLMTFSQKAANPDISIKPYIKMAYEAALLAEIARLA